MSERAGRPWLNYALGLACLGAVVAAVLVIGPATSSSASSRRTARAVAGVVQSTVSGSGNLEPASQLDLGFRTAGTVEHLYVRPGQHVTEGKLIATLDPVPAEVTLEQARAALQSAEASLAREVETNGEGSQQPSQSRSGDALSAATREANIASARAQVKSDQLAVRGDEQALADTKLYAPRDGTIVSLSGQVGEVVSATGTTRAASSSAGAGAEAGSGRSGGESGGAGASGGGQSGSGGSTQAFAVLSDLSSMKLVAALSESEIHEVKVGQIATVAVEALEGRRLAAHVSEVATLSSSSSSGVVSYDVTFALDQMDAELKPGMSATAEVLVKQEEGVSVPSSAISGGAVTVLHAGQGVRRQVTTGLAGDSATIVLSGLRAGETVLLPQAAGAGASSLSSLLRSRLGGGGAGLGGGGGGGPVLRIGG